MYKCTNVEKVKEFINDKLDNKYNGQNFYNKYSYYIKKYDNVLNAISNCESLGIPIKKTITKMGSSKKRYVYTFKPEVMLFLAVLNDDLCNMYDSIFSPNLFSYRKHIDIKSAFNYFLNNKEELKYAYKVDIHAYFNSINIDAVFEMIKPLLSKGLYNVLYKTYSDKSVIDNYKIVLDNEKGIIPGTSFSCFLANLYLKDLDNYFYENKVIYARYSDDIIVFAKSVNDLEEHKRFILKFLEEKGLSINSKKESVFTDYNFDFLGLNYNNGIVDLSKDQFKSMKMKIRRKTRTIIRRGKEKTDEYNLKKFIEYINNKIDGFPIEDEENSPSWKSWYARLVNTRKTIKLLNEYILDTAKYVYAREHNKARFKLKDSYIKSLGIKLM